MKTIKSVPQRFLNAVRRSFRQFLALPLATVLGFVGLNAVVYLADRSWSGGEAPAGFRWLGNLLGDSAALGSLLTTVAKHHHGHIDHLLALADRGAAGGCSPDGAGD